MRNIIYILLTIIFWLLVSVFINSCVTKTHVITEWDGDREIRWYTTEKQ